MQTVIKTAPYVRKETSTKRMMIDVLIALIPVVLFAIFRFKENAVFRIITSLIIWIGAEALFIIVVNKPKEKQIGFINNLRARLDGYTINNVTAPAVSAIIFAMLLPPETNYLVLILGALFGSVITKMMFGGLGANLFNPAGMGRFFLLVAFAGFLGSSYGELSAGSTPLGMEAGESLLHYSMSDLFFGNIPGAMGEISAVAILIGLAYLLIRRSADFRVVVSSALTFIVLMIFAGLGMGVDNLFQYVVFHLLSGGLLFGVTFMATDPVTSPVTRPGRLIYGFIIALIVVLIRIFGAYPEGVVIALLIGNMLVPLIDLPKWSTNVYNWKMITAMALVFLLASVFIYVAV